MNVDWAYIALKDVCKNVSRKFDFNKFEKVVFVNTGDVENGQLTNSEKISKIGLPGQAKKAIKKNDILYSEIRPGNKRFYYVNVNSDNFVVSTKFMVIEVIGNQILPRFLYLILKSQKCEQYFKTIAESRSGTFPQITFDSISSYEFLLPSVMEQSRIVNLENTIQRKIELNRQMNETLEAMAQAIFKDWFVDFGPVKRKASGISDPVKILGGLISDPDKAELIAKLFPDSFGDDGLPEGWKKGTLKQIAKEQRAKAKPEDISSDTPYIGLEHMPRGSIALDSWETAAKVTSAKSRFERNQILFGKLRPYFHKVGIAPISGICSTDIVVIDAIDSFDRALVCSICSSKEFVEYNTQASSGTRMPRTKWKVMGDYPIAIGQEIVRAAFSDLVSPMHEKIQQSILENQTLAETRDYLLPRLMSGDVRVADIAQTQSPLKSMTDLLGTKILTDDQTAEREAVMVASVINLFDSPDHVVGNFRYQKGVYFLRRKLELPLGGTTKKAAGPYDSHLRYQGGYKLAKQRRYIREASVNNRSGNKPAKSIQNALELVERYDLASGLNWVADHLKYKTNDELETLATVDFAINELKAKGSEITVENIIRDIYRDDIWRPKLNKSHFKKAKIRSAITELEKLFGGQND